MARNQVKELLSSSSAKTLNKRISSRNRARGVRNYLRNVLYCLSGLTNIFLSPFTMSSVNKRIKIYALEDVQSHKTSCWVYRGNKVYDVSTFLPDHPGGDDLILKYAGQSIDQAMKNPEEHEHSDSAYDMLEEYLIGRLGNQAAIVDESKLYYFIISIDTHNIHRLGCP